MRKTLLITILLALVFSPCLMAKIQVGEEVAESFETSHPYTGTGVVWEKTIHSPKAGYIAIHFASFQLAKNDVLEISSPDGRFFYTYREGGKNVKDKSGKNKQLSTFWATHIPGDTAIVKLVSKGKTGAYGFVIDKWVRGYEKGFLSEVMTNLEEDEKISRPQTVCGLDDSEWAKCYEGTDIYNKSKAVCRLLIDGIYACTGWLIGSQGHVMTNEHCIASQAEADNTDFEFMAEGADCTTDCSSWGACPGTIEASSGTLIKYDYDLDYALILLPTNVTSTYGYLQLKNALPAVGDRIYIPGHPSHYGKKIAVNSDTNGPYATVYSLDEDPCHGGPGDIGYFADSEGGSSGSPVLDYNDHLVISLHHCGTCPNRGVPITAIITHLGSLLPNDAIGGGAKLYCTNYSKNQNYEWISRVQVGALDNSTGASAYSDFTAITTNMTAGNNYAVTLTPGFASLTYNLYWKIWIDYNGDGDFEDVDEEVFSSTGNAAVSGNFTVPTGVSGQTRMRVTAGFGTPPTSCNSFKYGETEDYTVIIQ